MKNFFVLLLVLSFGKLAVAGVDISGEYRFREWSNFNNTVGAGRSHDSRFMLGASFREGDSLMAHMSLITVDSAVETNEVYGVWSFADAFELKFGKFSMDWANGSIFANNAWNNAPTTFDGVSLVYDAGMVKVTYAELGRDADVPTQAIAVDFMSLPAVAKTAHIFYITADTLSKYGAVVSGDVDMFNYELTYASDKNDEVSATMLNAEFGMNLMGMGQVLVTYHKDEAGYNPLDYDMHASAGLMDVNLWGGDNGLTYYTLGFVHSLNDSSAAGIMYHDFKATDSGDKLGTEIDVYASHKYNDVLTATARYGKYSPEAGDDYSQWMLGVNLNF